MKTTSCGGCGETNPDKRCLGCMHPFFDGDWPHQVADEGWDDIRKSILPVEEEDV